MTVSTPYQTLENELQSRLGPELAVVCTGVDGDPDGLWPEELSTVAHAVSRRRREFAAGRHAARVAMQRLGRPARAIPADADRSPRWPTGLVGTIAHTATICVAVVGTEDRWKAIGVDIEPDIGIDETLWDTICTPGERRQLSEHAPAARAMLATRVFVAKEAFYKWHYPQERTMLDFLDVSVSWSACGSDFEVSPHGMQTHERVRVCSGRLFALSGHVVAYCTTRAHGSRR